MRLAHAGTLVALTVTTLLLASPTLAETLDPHEDASGNDRDLTEDGTLTIEDGPFDKFSRGYNLTDGHLERTDSAFTADSGFSLTAAFEAWNLSSPPENVVHYRNSGAIWQITVDPDEVRVTSDSAACTVDLPGETRYELSLSIQHNDRSIQSDQTRIAVFDESGLVDSNTCNGDFNEATDGTLSIPAPGPGDIHVSELRFWSEDIDTDTLDAVADPTDDAFISEAQGDEAALYFLEPITFPGTIDALNTVNVWTVEHDDADELEVLAQAQNATASPLEPTDAHLTVTRTTDALVEYYNATSDTWTLEAVQNPLNTETSTLFNLTLPTDLEADSTIRLTATLPLVDDPSTARELAYGSHDLDADDPAPVDPPASVLSDTSFHDFSGLTSLEWGLFFLTALIGVFIWSKSRDHAVRAFGAVLPILAGVLLLGFGTHQGFGSVWMGTLATSAILLLVGLYMFVRLFLDDLTDAAGGP